MSLVPTVAAYLTLGTHVIFVIAIAAFLINRTPIGINRPLGPLEDFVEKYYREVAFVIVTAATSGSLYLSEVLGWEPCPLCWYQRIFMYPMVILFGVSAILKKDDVEDYVLPIALIGMGISGFHYLVQMVDEVQSTGCDITSIACETTHMLYFDYITVPMMALTAFTAVAVISYKFNGKKEKEEEELYLS